MFAKCIINSCFNNWRILKSDDQKKLIQLRRHVHHLYFAEGFSKNRIVREVGVSKHFVIKWTQSPDQDMTIDGRGWPKGRRRKWDRVTEERIAFLYKQLESDPQEFFTGATAIAHLWRKAYNEPPPPLRTIGQIKKELNLVTTPKKARQKGASRFLRYPERALYRGSLGQRIMEADFIQRRYLKGRPEPLHFVGFSAKKPPKFRYYKRIETLTSDNFIHSCDQFFSRFDLPDVLKLDNAATFIGSLSGKRTLSQVVLYLLEKKITPVFSVPRRPFTQASIEGNNSVFGRYFWNKRTFTDLADVDKQLEWFNASSRRYANYMPPDHREKKAAFVPKVYFLRQIHESETTPQKGCISIVNEEILLPAELINFFVLAEWNLKTEQLRVLLEEEDEMIELKKCEFEINQRTKNIMKKSGALSSCI